MTTLRNLEVQFDKLNEYFKDKKVKFTYEKMYGGYKLTDESQSHEFNTSRLTKTELWEMLYTINNVLREYTREENK